MGDCSQQAPARNEALFTLGSLLFDEERALRPSVSCAMDAAPVWMVRVSMDGKGRWMDNVFVERLWRSLKYESVYPA